MSQSYAFQVSLGLDFDAAVEEVNAALAEEGFGVLTEIDVKETMQEKLGKEFRRYAIFGACNPPLAHQALNSEPLVGLLLPCNVTVEETSQGSLVSILNPRVMLNVGPLRENKDVQMIAQEAAERLERVAETLKAE